MDNSYLFHSRNGCLYVGVLSARQPGPTQIVAKVCSMILSFMVSNCIHRSFAMAAAMFMNSNSLPIALMQSLVFTVPGLKWDNDDNQNAMLGRALSYLVMYSTLGMVVRCIST
jgi:auxin efflux carrier family protein